MKTTVLRLDPNSKLGRFVGHVVPGVVKPLHILWNEIIGFVFVVLAVWSIPSLVRNWRAFGVQGGSPFRLVVSALFTLIMAYFGVNSFLRARKISRS